jgi:sugar phosphate isomerase/epimerase
VTDARIGVCSWSLRPRGPDDLAGALRRLRVGSAQLALVPLVEEPAAWDGTAERLAAAGVRVASGMLAMAGENYSTLESIRRTGGVRSDGDWPRNRERAVRAARAAGRAGIRLVTFHAGFLDERRGGAGRSRMIERLREVADLFEEQGAAVAFETGQETAETLLDVLEELHRPGVGVNFDPANMILYGMGDPAAAFRRLAPFVRQVHVKDAVPSGQPGTWGREVPAGKGAVDWDAIFTEALAIDPPVDFIIERESGPDREPDIAAARDLVARHLAAVRAG